ncbi:MAG: oxidoreductase, zinc-binding dehydrogenase family [Gammaproteobacteria bacterium]|nr:oxidoreductase, zinc-binding dehydrogenase family [Gammaproteobacteria bacterium]
MNYRTYPDWDINVRKLTNDVGVMHVLEVGGQDTFPKAVASLAKGGHIGSIGGLGEGGFVREAPEDLLKPYNATWSYIYVGSRTDFENLNAFMIEHQIHPVIDRVFPYAETPAAYDYMKSGSFFGKIVIAIDK